MSKFYEVSEETIKRFYDVYNKKTFMVDISLQFIANESQKTLIKITKIPDQYSFLLKNDVLVSINDELMSVFDDEAITILMEQEIDKIIPDMASGKIKLIKPDLSTFSGLINKYGIEKISRANKVEELYSEQKRDGNDEFIA